MWTKFIVPLGKEVGTVWNRNLIDTSFPLPRVRKRHTVTAIVLVSCESWSPSRNRIWCILALISDIWCNGNNYNYFREKQLNKFRAVFAVKAISAVYRFGPLCTKDLSPKPHPSLTHVIQNPDPPVPRKMSKIQPQPEPTSWSHCIWVADS